MDDRWGHADAEVRGRVVMSTGAEPALPESDGLQFDRAEFAEAAAPAAVACAACKRPIVDFYSEINGTVFCESCRQVIVTNLSKGAGAGGVARATLMGIGAAIAGAAIYAGVQYLSKMQWSIVTVLIGYMVGTVVRKGSNGLGGLPYQVIAAGLTYLSIALANFFLLVGPFLVQDPRALLQLLRLALPEIVRGCLVEPFQDIQAHPLSLVIVGFGLWQAWRLNQRARFVVTGPYRVAEAAGPGPAGVAQP